MSEPWARVHARERGGEAFSCPNPSAGIRCGPPWARLVRPFRNSAPNKLIRRPSLLYILKKHCLIEAGFGPRGAAFAALPSFGDRLCRADSFTSAFLPKSWKLPLSRKGRALPRSEHLRPSARRRPPGSGKRHQRERAPAGKPPGNLPSPAGRAARSAATAAAMRAAAGSATRLC